EPGLEILLLKEKQNYHGRASIRTSPLVPSTVTVMPSRMVVVPTRVPTTAGSPNSRATIAQWLRMPPESATTPLTVANSGTHGGTVISQTMMSPCWSLLASINERTTFAVPCTVPGEAATPVMMLGSLLG